MARNIQPVMLTRQINIANDEVDLPLCHDVNRLLKAINGRGDCIACLGKRMFIVERHEGLILDNEDSLDCPPERGVVAVRK